MMHAGEIIDVDFGVPAGSEPGFTRPAAVVTAELILRSRPRTVHVVPRALLGDLLDIP